MRFGLALPTYGRLNRPAALAAIVETAERLGYDSLWVSDHVLMPPAMYDPYADNPDALVTLGWLAARTTTPTLGVSVLVLPLRHPVVVAKQLATADDLSGGRVVVGVGVGWLEEEFALLGAQFADRGATTDRSLDVLSGLVGGQPELLPAHLAGVRLFRSVDHPIPIVVGGSSWVALRRAARRGIGWHAIYAEPEEIRQAWDVLSSYGARDDFEITLRTDVRIGEGGQQDVGLGGDSASMRRKLLDYASVGVREIVIDLMDRNHRPLPPLNVFLNQIERFADVARTLDA